MAELIALLQKHITQGGGAPTDSGELQALRTMIRKVVETRLVQHADYLEPDQLVEAESTVRLIKCALQSAPAVVFESQKHDKASNLAHVNNPADLLVLSQLYSTMIPNIPVSPTVSSMSSSTSARLPFDIWLIGCLSSLLTSHALSRIRDRILHLLTDLITSLIYQSENRAESASMFCADLIQATESLESLLCSQSSMTSNGIHLSLFPSEQKRFENCSDRYVLQVNLKSRAQLLDLYSDILSMMRLLDHEVPSILLQVVDRLWRSSIAVFTLMAEAKGGTEDFHHYAMECMESWRCYMVVLDYLPASVMESSLCCLFQLLVNLLDSESLSLNIIQALTTSYINFLEELFLVAHDSDIHEAFAQCHLEEIVSHVAFKRTFSEAFQAVILKCLTQSTSICAVQNLFLVGPLLELGSSPTLYPYVVKCLTQIGLECTSVEAVDSSCAVAKTVIYKRIEGKRARLDIDNLRPKGLSLVELLSKFALESFKAAECSSEPYSSVQKLQIICNLLLQKPSMFEEFLESVLPALEGLCSKICSNQQLQLDLESGILAVAFFAKSIAEFDSTRSKSASLLNTIAIILLSPWDFSMLSLSRSTDSKLTSTSNEYLNLKKCLTNQEGNWHFPSASINVKLNCLLALAQLLVSPSQKLSLSHCHAFAVVSLLNESLEHMSSLELTESVWKQLVPLFCCMDQDLWSWSSSQLKLSTHHSKDVMLIIAKGLENLACTLSGCWTNEFCKMCDNHGPNAASMCSLSFLPWQNFEFLLHGDVTVRLAMIKSLKRIVCHSAFTDRYLDRSPILANLLKGLDSSSREVRMATLSIPRLLFPLYFEEGSSEATLMESNKLEFFTSLKRFIDASKGGGKLDIVGTCLLAVGQLGQFCHESLIFPILHVLIHELGNKNAILRSIAYEQVKSLSKARNKTPQQLFQPHLSEFSVYLIDNLSVDGLLREFSKLIGVSAKALLESTAEFTLPHLILHQKGLIINELAAHLSLDVPILLVNHMSSILKALFMWDNVLDLQAAIRYLIETIKPKINSVSINTLIHSCELDLVVQLVMALGDEARKAKAFKALNTVVIYLTDKADVNQHSHLPEFLLQHFLAVLSNVNLTLSEQNANSGNEEKKKAVNCLIELMSLVGAKLSGFTTQIMTTLQTAFNIPVTQTSSLSAWDTFVKALEPHHVGPILNQTAAILLSKWNEKSEYQQQKIANILQSMVLDNISHISLYLPALCKIPVHPLFESLQMAILPHKPSDALKELQFVLKAVSHENSTIVQVALNELRQLLKREQNLLLKEILSESTSSISHTISCLLKTLNKYNGTSLEIQLACCECLGILGGVDPARVNVPISSSAVVNLDSFDSKDASVAFVCHLIEIELAPAFRSASTTQSQSHLAFCIQELLRFCDFGPGFQSIGTKSNTSTLNPQLLAQWKLFSAPVLEVVCPLLTSKYSMLDSKLQRHVQCPIYSMNITFKEWLQLWVVSLMGKATGTFAKPILGACMKIVEVESISIASYLLPRLVLNVLAGGTSETAQELLVEFNTVLNDVINKTGSVSLEKRKLASQVIFQLVDYLSVWIRTRRKEASRQRLLIARKSGRFLNPEDAEDDKDSQCQRVIAFVTKIPSILMAEASYSSNSHLRALVHFEQHIRSERKSGKTTVQLQNEFDFLQRIYSGLDEPDGMEGISSLFLNPSVEQQIREHEAGGHWMAAQTCYEVALQKNPNSFQLQIGLIQCLKNLGHLGTMLSHISGVCASHPEWLSQMNTHAIEASWHLGSWDSLDACLSKPFSRTFQADIGSLLMLARKRDHQKFLEVLKISRITLIAPLSAASMESYTSGYSNIVKLHMLHEIEAACEKLWEDMPTCTRDREVFSADFAIKAWDSRLKITVPSLKVREPILSVRRVLVTEIGLHSSSLDSDLECGKIWLQTAKALQSAGYFQPAYSAILHAADHKDPNAMLQKAKWLAETNQYQKSIAELNSILGQLDSNLPNVSHAEDARSNLKTTALVDILKGKVLLLRAKQMDEHKMVSLDSISAYFAAVTQARPDWEKGYYFYGRYFNQILENEAAKGSSGNLPRGHLIVSQGGNCYHVCKYFLKALQNGARYIYQTLPRVLTLYLDAGHYVAYHSDTAETKQSQLFRKIHSNLMRAVENVPAWQFLPSVPQLISRIGHKNKAVVQMIQVILQTVLASYPQQTLWNLLSISRSKIRERADRCKTVLDKVQTDPVFRESRGNELDGIIGEGKRLSEELLNLCNYQILGKETLLNLSRDFKNLKRLAPLRMILPTQQTLMLTLPSDFNAPAASHKPFPFAPPTIEGFYDDIEIMNSLQKPRKIQILGSDGKDYIFLLKPKDDLRKDARLMEFNGLINKLLKKDPESRKRNLHVRTYAVVPLNEECGIIEWVENTSGFRHIVMKGYKSKGTAVMPIQEARELLDGKKLPVDEAFVKLVLPKYPAIFHEWFLETFPEPTKWFASRLSYSGTVAVMSMVGYVVGLGDRHGENILFDELTGDCVHVDLNCLFEKGLTFEKPEKVPFRLTQNMVDAFGVTGTEGVFRKACEFSLRVLRNNRESLMAVLETFIHDPLCEWTPSKPSRSLVTKGRTSAGITISSAEEQENPEALKVLNKIETKLKGLMKGSVPLSIEGQVQELISEATDPKNLGAMYIGWAPFL
ncbi:hypothetical protein BC830DRAFT_1134506 [Chytriomyces sp. MP71]|nr:hypothetical protein BC830DRAFT_1134506 [Chytriomyces sp. MP71]